MVFLGCGFLADFFTRSWPAPDGRRHATFKKNQGTEATSNVDVVVKS